MPLCVEARFGNRRSSRLNSLGILFFYSNDLTLNLLPHKLRKSRMKIAETQCVETGICWDCRAVQDSARTLHMALTNDLFPLPQHSYGVLPCNLVNTFGGPMPFPASSLAWCSWRSADRIRLRAMKLVPNRNSRTYLLGCLRLVQPNCYKISLFISLVFT